MALRDISPDMGACSGIPDMGAWQFVIPDGLRDGTFLGRPVATGKITGTSAGTGALGARLAVEGKFSADQS